MRAKALVPILAEIFGVSPETAFVIDRGLAEAGYRAKGKGRAWPEMTRREALYFLIACMTSTTAKGKVATRAAEDVKIWTSAITTVKASWETYAAYGDEEESADELIAALGVDIDPEDLAHGPRIIDRSISLPFVGSLHGKTVSLIDYLLEVMRYLEGDGRHRSLEDVVFSLSPSHLTASVSIHLGYGKHDKEAFFVEDDDLEAPFDHAIRTDISVDGNFLAAIAIRTADPLAETAD